MRIRQIAREPSRPYRLRRVTSHAIIHHTESRAESSAEANWDYQVRTHGWIAGGYHFSIGPKGDIVAWRHVDVVGSHSAPFNTLSIGIALVGSFLTRPAPRPQAEAAATLIRHLELRYGSLEVLGHGEAQPGHTDCPGPYVAPQVRAVLEKVPPLLWWY